MVLGGRYVLSNQVLFFLMVWFVLRGSNGSSVNGNQYRFG